MRSRLFVAAAAVLLLAACSNSSSPDTASSPANMAPAPTSSAANADNPLFIADDLPLLPAGAASAPRPLAVVKAAYEFAARHPEVISYVPCFCGCERGGHKSNESCFVAGRKNGKITWDSHGTICDVCLDVATETMEMSRAGASVAQIRQLIEKKYGPLYEGHTPTPPPPARSGGDTKH